MKKIYANERSSRLTGISLGLVMLAFPIMSAAGFRDVFIDPQDGMFDTSKYLSENSLGFLPIPLIITEPAVGTGLGVVGIFFHESAAQKKQRTSASQAKKEAILPENITVAGLAATDNGTKGIGIGHLGFWKKDTLRYKGYLLYPTINMNFYTLGGVELPVPIKLNVEGPMVLNEIKFRIGSGDWFVGVHQLYRDVEVGLIIDGDRGLLPPPGTFPPLDDFLASNLSRKVTTSGLGVLAEYDSRNNIFNPENGYSYTFKYMQFDDAIGSDIDYSSYSVATTNYWTLSEKFVLGFRLKYDGVSASDDERLPPYIPPMIDLRGVPAARYQANNAAVTEVQLDYKLSNRWKLGVFLGAGRVAEKLSELSDASTVVSKGVGFRYLIARRYGFVMGADIARGPEETAFYIQAGSTW